MSMTDQLACYSAGHSITRLIFHVVRPVLTKLDVWSAPLEKLLVMIALHQSLGLKRRRSFDGRRLGIFQIAKPEFEVVMRHMHHGKIGVSDGVSQFVSDAEQMIEYQTLENNDAVSCAIAAIKLTGVKDGLPRPECDVGLAHFAAKYWSNGDASEYWYSFRRYRADMRPLEWGEPPDQ